MISIFSFCKVWVLWGSIIRPVRLNSEPQVAQLHDLVAA